MGSPHWGGGPSSYEEYILIYYKLMMHLLVVLCVGISLGRPLVEFNDTITIGASTISGKFISFGSAASLRLPQ